MGVESVVAGGGVGTTCCAYQGQMSALVASFRARRDLLFPNLVFGLGFPNEDTEATNEWDAI
jgi:hypothetical protein